MTFRTKDSAWVKQSFMMALEASDDVDLLARTRTTASYKFVDTTLGGNYVINPLPQYTKYADIKRGGFSPMKPREERASGSRGMGRYYSEAIDDHNQVITLRFGVPQFNSISNFFSGAVNAQAAQLARTGRAESNFFLLGKAAIYAVASTIAAPAVFIYTVYRFFAAKPVSKYYYMKPTMPLYWNAVSSMLNTLAVNMAIAPYGVTDAQKAMNDSDAASVTTSDMLKYAAALPGIFNKDGRIDVYTMATRAQRVADLYNKRVAEIMETGDTNTIQNNLQSFLTEMMDVDKLAHMSLETYLNTYYSDSLSGITGTSGNSAKEADGSTGGDAANSSKTANSDTSSTDVESTQWDELAKDGFIDFAIAEARDGASFVSFRVDAMTSMQESFSNQVGESDISQSVNSLSSQGRSKRFDFAGGNLIGGVLGETIGAVTDGISSFLKGMLPDLAITGLATLAGSAFIDIPKTWQSSTANLPRADFTISLRCPYGNKVARYMYLYVPLCMLLAGALPLATGAQSYTSPFLCELFSRSRTQIRLGMIESMSITRGGGNLPWAVDDGPLQIDVSFSVVDMSSILYMPIAPSITAMDGAVGLALHEIGQGLGGDSGSQAMDKASAWFDSSTYSEDNSFTDYLAVLGGLSLADQVYTTQKWRLNVARNMLNAEAWRSPAHFASIIIGTLPGRIINAWANRTNRP